MLQNYKYYKFADYLADDFFMESMLSPTTKSKVFWLELIDKGQIDVDEFLSASIFVEAMQKSKPEILSQRTEQLWQRINTTRTSIRQKNRKIRLYRWVPAAACVAFLIVGSLTFLMQKTHKEDMSTVHTQTIKIQSDNDRIRIVTKDRQMEINENGAEIHCGKDGSLIVNDRVMEKQPESSNPQDKPSFSELHVPYGKRAQLTLSDGSSLHVNSGTTVVFSDVFQEDKREIYVAGEVYAEIKKNDKCPFVVKTDHMNILVTGTSFNVSAYKEDNLERVVLVNGAVDINVQGNKTHLKPSQAYTFMEQGSTLESVDVELYTAWRDGIYIFKNESIEYILMRLARYYNISLIFPERSSGTVCSGKLELKEDISSLLNNLSQIAYFNFAVKNNEYRIHFQ